MDIQNGEILESNKYLEKNYPVSISETDCKGLLKPAVLFNYMQDIAAKSIERLSHKFSWDELFKQGRGWFLIRYRVEFDDYPANISNVIVKTENRGTQRIHAYRDFSMYDAVSGKRFLKATSLWFIVDLLNKSVVNLTQEYPEYFSFEKREDDLSFNKLKSIDKIDNEKVFHVRYDDLDFNGHVNNTVYVTWAMEVLDIDFRATHKIKNMDIYFKHEVKYGDDILSQVMLDEQNLVSNHVIKSVHTGEELCLLRFEYVK